MKIREKPLNIVEYKMFTREHDHVFQNTPIEVEVWISRAWNSYHTWEDCRSNYA